MGPVGLEMGPEGPVCQKVGGGGPEVDSGCFLQFLLFTCMLAQRTFFSYIN